MQLINREKAVLIDVSEPAEYAAGHAVGARSVPLASLETSRDLPKNKALPLVVVCPTGARAPRAVGALKKLGFENARALGRRPGRLARGQPADREGRPGAAHVHATGIERWHAHDPSRCTPRWSARTAMRAKALLKQRGVEAIDEIRVDLHPAQRADDDRS